MFSFILITRLNYHNRTVSPQEALVTSALVCEFVGASYPSQTSRVRRAGAIQARIVFFAS